MNRSHIICIIFLPTSLLFTHHLSANALANSLASLSPLCFFPQPCPCNSPRRLSHVFLPALLNLSLPQPCSIFRTNSLARVSLFATLPVFFVTFLLLISFRPCLASLVALPTSMITLLPTLATVATILGYLRLPNLAHYLRSFGNCCNCHL